MNQIYILKAFRKIYAMLFNLKPIANPACEQDPDIVSKIIYDKLMEDEPCMIARFGAFELSTLVNYLGVKKKDRNIFRYVQGKSKQWWWDKKLLNYMNTNAGFFPPTPKKIEQFCELMLDDVKQVDILGSWLADEVFLFPFMDNPTLVARGKFDPFWVAAPWTKALAGRKVLVIHPFASQIQSQYLRRDKLFKDPNFLPEFELLVLPAVQSLGGDSDFRDWFEALDSMRVAMDEIDFDIVLIGAGAYGFPLAAHAKRMGKRAIHIGGSLQLFFGIIGKRWENEPKIHGTDYPGLINDFWERPNDSYKPKNHDKVEGSCYW